MAITAGASAGPEHVLPSGATHFVVSSRDRFGRLRVFAAPGDLGLRNGAVTAIVRRKTGVLVDFWPNKPARPTVAQLGEMALIDGLWQLETQLVRGKSSHSVRVAAVRHEGEHIVVEGRSEVDGAIFGVATTFVLARGRAEIELDTRVTYERGSAPLEVSVHDVVRWGNADCFAEGHGRLPAAFKGRTRSIGRKGASGDLVFRAAPGASFDLDFQTEHAGLRPPLDVGHGVATLAPGATLRVRRTLAYAPVAMPAVPPPTAAPASVEIHLVDEKGRPLPGKLTFSGVKGSKNPDFGPDGDESGADRFVWTGSGTVRRRLPPGSYDVLATSGIERDAARFPVTLGPAEHRVLRAVLPRVIDTPGVITADLHLHQAPSVDADISLRARIISVAAEGVELAAATDHYAVTDFGPTVRALQRSGALVRPVSTFVGSEVSTTGSPRFGHFNVFPVKLGAQVQYEDTTPKRLFAEMRNVSPEGIIQVNHPRWDRIGYFRYFDMDEKTARVPPERAAQYAADFDALEVYNGVDLEDEKAIFEVFRDWLHLLALGHRYTATGNSDSHDLFFVDPGLPRNFITYREGGDDDTDALAPAEAVIAAIRGGRVVVSSGPVIDARVGGVGPGGVTKLATGRALLAVRVRAAPWVDVRHLEVYIGGSDQPAVRRAIAPSTQVTRFEAEIPLPVAPPTFVVVLARGERPLENVHARGALPFGFTNPLWITR